VIFIPRLTLPAEARIQPLRCRRRPSRSGCHDSYVISDLTGTDEIASLIGRQIGVPDLRWVKFPAKDFKRVLLNYGFAEGAANDYVEMFAALDTGLLFEDIKRPGRRSEGHPSKSSQRSGPPPIATQMRPLTNDRRSQRCLRWRDASFEAPLE